MKTFKQLLLLISLLLLTALESHAQDLPRGVILRKGSQWVFGNQTLVKRKIQKTPDVVYSKAELFGKMLDVYQEEKPFGWTAYSGLQNMILIEPVLAQEFKSKLITTINEFVDISESHRSKLLALLNGEESMVEPFMLEQNIRKNDISIPDVLDNLKKTFQSLKLPIRQKEVLVGSMETLNTILLDSIDDDDCYNNNPNCQFGSNKGIRFYYRQRIEKNHELALVNLRMGMRIQHLNEEYKDILGEAPTHADKYDIDLWPMVMEVSNDDPSLALEVVSTFGHDVCCNSLPGSEDYQFLIDNLNGFRPSSYGGDYNPRSIFFLPGVLSGVMPSKKSVRKLSRAIKQFNKVFGENIKMRHGYHHVYGGVLIAQALHAQMQGKVFSINWANLISQSLGYMYKRLQIPRYLKSDAKELWNNMNQNEFRRIKRPKGWERERFNKAKAELKLHLAILNYTESQHRAGAKFASRVYRRGY